MAQWRGRSCKQDWVAQRAKVLTPRDNVSNPVLGLGTHRPKLLCAERNQLSSPAGGCLRDRPAHAEDVEVSEMRTCPGAEG